MDISSIVDEVHTYTRRPDMASLSLSAIKNAIKHMHSLEDFPMDIKENTIVLDEVASIHSIYYKDIWPLFRKLDYIIPVYDGQPAAPLTLISPKDLFDSAQQYRADVYYVAGDSLQIKTSCATDTFILSAYVWPEITDDTTDSWIATDYTAAIVYKAAFAVLTTLGSKEDADAMLRLYDEQRKAVLVNFTIEGA